MTKIDLIITVFIVISFVMGLYRGFVRTLFSCLGGIVSFAASAYVASHFSSVVSEAFFAPHISQRILTSITETAGENASAADLWSSQSEYLRGLLRTSGLSEDTLRAASHPLETLANAIGSAVGQSIAYAVLFCVSFVLCTLLLHTIAKILDLATRLPVLHSFNALLGGLLGAVFSLALCTCVLWALKLFVPSMYSDYGLLPPSEMRQSPIAGTLVGWNDGVSLFEMIPAE